MLKDEQALGWGQLHRQTQQAGSDKLNRITPTAVGLESQMENHTVRWSIPKRTVKPGQNTRRWRWRITCVYTGWMFREIRWTPDREEHIAGHNVTTTEVEELLLSRPLWVEPKNEVVVVAGVLASGRYLLAVILAEDH